MLSLICRNKSDLLIKRFLHTSRTRRSTGYVVLIPEIGEDAHLSESIIKSDGLPQFNTVTIENCLGVIGHQANAIENTVDSIETRLKSKQTPVNVFDEIFNEFEEVTGPLETTWGVAKTLYLANSTPIPTKTYLNIHDRARNARASKFTNDTIFAALKKANEDSTPIETEKKRLLEKYILEGKLNGLGLPAKAKDNLAETINHLGKERAHFKNKIIQSVNHFSHTIHDYNLVRDFPPNLIEATAKDSSHPTKGPWRITLQPQIVQDFLKYCPDRNERWNVWQADVRKGSGHSGNGLETSTHLEKIRGLRKRQAQLLGFQTYSAMSMETKLIKTVDNAKQMFTSLLRYAGPAQSVEIQNLQQFAGKSGFDHKLDLYDVTYWQRKQLLSEFDLDEESLKEFFPLPRVLDGLFSLAEKLFDLKIVERKNTEVWHPSVKYYDIFHKDDSSEPVAGFYLDCYSKDDRQIVNSGYMVGIRNRNVIAKNSPLSALIFNFNTPLYGKPYLLSQKDLRMVFKTFGTTLQHLLTKANYSDLAGLSNIEWDASQVCGQVMVNFLDDVATIKQISGHYANDEAISDELLKNIKLLKTNLAGYNLCHELYLSDLDLELHQSGDFWLDIVKRLWPVYKCMPLDKKNAHPCSMTDIFSGDWAAAYFSHLYSKVIAADVYEAFADGQSEQVATGKRFKETFLAYGGSMRTGEVFRHFRGRDPSVEALLKSLNLLNSSPTTDY